MLNAFRNFKAALAVAAFPLFLCLVPVSNANAQESEALQEPELLYVGWRSAGKNDGIEYQLFLPDGTAVASEEAVDVVRSLSLFEFPVPARAATPDLLLLVFSVDWRSPKYSLQARIALADTRSAVFELATNQSMKSWVVVSTPLRSQNWPESCSLTIRYPIEEPVEIWRIEEPPFGDTQIVEGISCAIRNDQRGRYLETCFRPNLGDWEEHIYLVTAQLEGDEETVPNRPPRLTGVVEQHEYELTEHFDTDRLDYIRAMKQTCRGLDLGEIKIRKDKFPDR